MSRTRRTVGRLALGLLLVPAALAASPGPALAEAHPVGVSLDGRRWAHDVNRPLFDPSRRWVPGDRQTVEVWVRNRASEAAVLSLRLSGASASPVRLLTSLDGAPVSATGQPLRVVPAGSEPARISITAELPASAGPEIQGRSADLTLEVTLTEEAGVGGIELTGGADAGADRGAPGLLPATGSTGLLAPLLTGLAALVSGTLLLRRRGTPNRPGGTP